MKKSEYVELITQLVSETNDIPLLDLILKILEKSI